MSKKFDSLLEQLGSGRWNFIAVILLGYWSIQLPAFVFGGNYLTPNFGHTCKIPVDGEPIYIEGKANQTLVDACWYTKEIQNVSQKLPCLEWDFDNSTFTTTITSEFQLVCGKEFLRPTFNSMYYFGSLVSAPITGFLSDRYGRKTIAGISMVSFSFFGNLMNWLPNLSSILATRFILGFMQPGTLAVGYALVLEHCAPKHRAIVGIVIWIPWIFGYFTWAGEAYLLRDWRWLMFVAPIPSVFVVVILWFVDESPRWLIIKGHHDKALTVLQRAARLNKQPLPSQEDIYPLMKEIQDEHNRFKKEDRQGSSQIQRLLATALDEVVILFKTKTIRKVTLCVIFLYFTCEMVYIGLHLIGGSVGSGPFMYMILIGVMDLPGNLIPLPMLNTLGRSKTNIVFFFGAGLSLLLLTVIPKGWVATTMALISKAFIAAAYIVAILHATELFPTEVRTRGLGVAIMIGKLGAIIVPYITDSLATVCWWAPSVLCGLVALLACPVCYMLPETKDIALPDTVTDLEMTAERMRKVKKIQSKTLSGEI